MKVAIRQRVASATLFVAVLALSAWPLQANVFQEGAGATAAEKAGDAVPSLDPEVATYAESTLQQPIEAHRPKAMEAELYARALAKHGEVDPLIAFLDGRASDADEAHWRLNASRLAAHMTWRYGDLEDALGRFEAILAADTESAGQDLDALLSRARLLDALGRSKDALAAYGDTVPLISDAAVSSRVQLRMALMSMESGDEERKDALAEFALTDGQSLELRNRSAVVLALWD